jgi:hypothetical protein
MSKPRNRSKHLGSSLSNNRRPQQSPPAKRCRLLLRRGTHLAS